MCSVYTKKCLGLTMLGLTFIVFYADDCTGQVLLDRDVPVVTPPELNPVGAMHIPIGIPDSLDSLKTFVEAEGGFSPGVGSFGVSFWVYDLTEKKLRSPTMGDVEYSHGLADRRALIPWSEWTAGGVRVRTDVCEVRRDFGETV